MSHTTQSYHEEQKQKNTARLRYLMLNLPPFCEEFFRGIGNTKSARTRVAYAYDLKVFFNYIVSYHPILGKKKVRDLTIEDLMHIGIDDFELYMEYLSYYTTDTKDSEADVCYQNDESGKARKMACVRTMYSYFYRKSKIPSNLAALIDMPKIHVKRIIRLDTAEIGKLLDEVESGANLNSRQKKFHEYTRIRDLAIVTILLGTGIRVSECVGIDISDLDFVNNGVKITRKGGNESVIYFPAEVKDALIKYIVERRKRVPKPGYENALFLSLQNKRINVRTVEKLVKKYSSLATPLKRITPHKFRSTYGTNLYRATGDIYLVADVLGHKDVNTTKRHYADMSEENRKRAAQYVKLR